MHAKKILGVAGAGAVVSAAVMIPAGIADAGTTYNSTATASPGSMSIEDRAVPITAGPVTATNANPNMGKTQGLQSVAGTVSSINSQAGSEAQKVIPANADLIAETATASPNGTSTACSAVVAQGCVDNKPQPVTFQETGASSSGTNAGADQSSGTSSLGKSALPGISGLAGQQAQTNRTSAASALSGYSVKVVAYGPAAACTAGPEGKSGSGFSATSIPGSLIITIYNNGKALGPPTTVQPGNVLSQLPLDSTLSALVASSGTQLDYKETKGTASSKGPETTATGGETILSDNGDPVLDMKGGKVTCGPNKAAAATPSPKSSSPASTPATGSSGTGGSGTSGSGTSSSAETPMKGGIQTDEGRSGPGSDGGAWAAAAGAGVVGGTASGLTLWLRRRRLS